MKAMILAAGRGRRLRPLTDTCPKPLIKINDKPLIAYHIERLAKAGIKEIVINVSHLGEQIIAYIKRGEPWQVPITCVEEAHPLEVGGGILNALPCLGAAPFIIVNADIWTDFDFSRLLIAPDGLAHIVLVDNPNDHRVGDFSLDADGTVVECAHLPKYTYSGMAVIRPELFLGQTPGVLAFYPLLKAAMLKGQLSAEHYPGFWADAGTPERLAHLKSLLSPLPLRKTS